MSGPLLGVTGNINMNERQFLLRDAHCVLRDTDIPLYRHVHMSDSNLREKLGIVSTPV
jgi:hypothetical protein